MKFEDHLFEFRILLLNHVTEWLHTVLTDIIGQFKRSPRLLPTIGLERLDFLGKEADLD